MSSDSQWQEPLDKVIADIIAPQAAGVDRDGRFPSDGMRALGAAGILGLVSAEEAGGLGQAHRAATLAVEKIAGSCASTAMVTCMHLAAAAVVEAHGPIDVRGEVASGRSLATLAFSEAGSRSQFWAPTSTAARVNGSVRLDAKKSWVTSAGEAGVFVWSSRPAEATGLSSLWLVRGEAPGLSIGTPFDGLGLRGNDSSPMIADGVMVSPDAGLGEDGKGFDVMMGVVLPYFQLMSAGICVGMMDAATSKAAQHVGGTRFAHDGQALADLPTVRSFVARMRIKTDMVRALLRDTLDALERGRDDAMLRVLEVKAAAGEASTEVTDLAMRVCGGAAFRKEVGVERIFRDARAATVMAPTTDVLYDFVGKAVCGMPLFG